MFSREKSSASLIRCLVIIIATISSATQVLASPADGENVISTQMLKCLKLPTNSPKSYSISAVAVLKDGTADFVSINFRAPPSEWEMAAAPLVADAITQCEPYNSIS